MPEIDIDAFRAAIEAERHWRSSEIKLLKNQIALMAEHQDVARKALVVMLYAHFEGLVKMILTSYVETLCSLNISLSDLHVALVPVALDDVFRQLRIDEKKNPLFKNVFPDEQQIHRYSREREFLERTYEFGNRVFSVTSDRAIDLESNVNGDVLMKNLYRLGLDPNLVREWKGAITRLVSLRNDIAHGARREGITEKEYEANEENVERVVTAIVVVLTKHLNANGFRATYGPHLLVDNRSSIEGVKGDP